MKLIGYKSTSSGLAGIADHLIRFRLKGIYTHTEIMFEPGDGVEAYMPDRKLELYGSQQFWCASSSGIDTIPKWSSYRKGKRGGVRFKMIDVNPDKWDIVHLDADPLRAASYFKSMQGMPYDYSLMLSYVSWLVAENPLAVNCSEACASALDYEQAWRYDPCLLMDIAKRKSQTCPAPSFATP